MLECRYADRVEGFIVSGGIRYPFAVHTQDILNLLDYALQRERRQNWGEAGGC